MKRYLFTISIAIATSSIPTIAQNLVDATRYSATSISGTARYKSMAGAFGAVGGDPSCITGNPAGIGIYRGTSEITFTPNLSVAKTTSYGDVKGKQKKTNFSIGNFSYIVSFKTDECEHLTNFNIGISMNHSEGVKRRYTVTRDYAPSSFGAYLANLTNNALLLTGHFFDPGYLASESAWKNNSIPLMSLMAYDTYAIDNGYDNQGNEMGVVSYDQQEGLDAFQRLYVREENRTDEYNLNLSANWNDFIYAGATFSIVDFNSIINSSFKEDYSFEYNGSYTDYQNDLETKGTGFNMKLGVIARLADFWRIGLAVHTPTWFHMTDYYDGVMSTDADGGSTTNSGGPYEYKYRFYTPWKYQFSTAFIVGTRGIISLEYNMDDYRSMRYKQSNYYDFDYTDFNFSKNNIKDFMQEVHTIKAGGEWRITPKISLRAGYAYQTSPYKDEIFNIEKRWEGVEEAIYSSSTKPNFALQDDTEYYTCGIGYRGKGWYADFSFMNKIQHEKVGMFPSSDALYYNENGVLSYTDDPSYGAVTGTLTSLKTKTLNFDITLGFKF